jgi:hypothetical protein
VNTRDVPNDDTLRRAFTAPFRPAREGADCPPPETLWSSAREELVHRDDDEVLTHIGECGVCAAAWQVARDLAIDSAEQPAPVHVRSAAGWRWMAVAAAILVGLAVGVPMFMEMQESTAPVFRTAEGDWLQPTFDVNEPLARDRCMLRWASGPEGTTYHVRITSETLDLLAQGKWLQSAEFLVPASALEDLPDGARIFWQVSARLPDGRKVDSTTFISTIE